jgi:hypothetical protein
MEVEAAYMQIRFMNTIAFKPLSVLMLLSLGLLTILGSGGGGGGDGSGDTIASGEYRGTYVDPYNASDSGSWQFQFTQNGSSVSGTMSAGEGSESITGTVSGDTFTFSSETIATGTLTISGNDISGQCESHEGDDWLLSGSLYSGSPLSPVVASGNNDISGHISGYEDDTYTSFIPVAGVQIYLKELPSISTTSAANGYFFLGGMPDGTYTIIYAKDGYKTMRATVSFESTHHTDSEIILCPGVDIDEGLLGNWLEYQDPGLTTFASNAIYIADGCASKIKELKCDGDTSSEACEWYYSAMYGYTFPITEAASGQGIIEDGTLPGLLIDYSVDITYSIIGDKLTISTTNTDSYFYPARYYKFLKAGYPYRP